jgi:hypothetical protein
MARELIDTAHLLGNGPSKKLFERVPDVPVFGCNLGDDRIQLEAVFIMDQTVINHIQNNAVAMACPIIVPGSMESHVRKYVKTATVYDTVDRELVNGESTGHKAVEYLLKKGCREIHMWGFDSLYESNVLSDTQAKIPGSIAVQENYLRWRERWDQIFESEDAQQSIFFIHR